LSEAKDLTVIAALDQIGETLREHGRTLDDKIEQCRAIRGQLLQERLGIADADIASSVDQTLSEPPSPPGVFNAGRNDTVDDRVSIDA
jgi:hypothetical protein